MSSDSPQAPEAPKGLPTVTAPSGRHIVQLFLIPGLIVAGAVTILLGFSWLAGGSRTPDQFLKNIDNANKDIRWRAANDLAQVLKRDDKLASDTSFALQINDHLAQAIADLERAEKSFNEIDGSESNVRSKAEALETLKAQRNYVQYLISSLGNFSVPVGIPMLTDLARHGRGKDEKLIYLIRRSAVWAISNLGDGLKRFQKLPDDQKNQIRHNLEDEAKSGSDLQQAGAKAALDWMDGKSIGVISTLADCARDDRDLFLRVESAHAHIFWEGTPDEQKLADKTLLMLTRDLGKGHDNRIEIGEKD
jgi:hypothetical protein